jgi:hypothetical protein
LAFKNACQLEGSDHGGRDSAAELAQAGTIDVQMPDGSCNRLDFGASPIRRAELYTRQIIRQRISEMRDFPERLTPFEVISILQTPQVATAR